MTWSTSFFTAPLLLGVCIGGSQAQADSLRLDSPRDYQIFQRDSRYSGKIVIAGEAVTMCERIEARISPAQDVWQPLPFDRAKYAFREVVTVPAGGYYTVAVRVVCGGKALNGLEADYVGVGEVFVIAGQSNATNYGEALQTTQTGMVTSFDGKKWHLADDPQWGVQDNSKNGSFIPAFGDAMYEKYRVPIGVADVGHGSTSVRQWLPSGERFALPPTMSKYVHRTAAGNWESDGTLFNGMMARIRQLSPNGFRALLWHQGESDAHQQIGHEISGLEYSRMLKLIIGASRREAGRDFPWFVAQVSYHTPTDPSTPEIREAQTNLWRNGVALEGPDTDQLTGSMRQNNGTGVHMSDAGLKAHGKLWADKVSAWLDGVLNR